MIPKLVSKEIWVTVYVNGGSAPHSFTVMTDSLSNLPRVGEQLWIASPQKDENNWLVKVTHIHHMWSTLDSENSGPRQVDMFVTKETSRFA